MQLCFSTNNSTSLLLIPCFLIISVSLLSIKISFRLLSIAEFLPFSFCIVISNMLVLISSCHVSFLLIYFEMVPLISCFLYLLSQPSIALQLLYIQPLHFSSIVFCFSG